MTETNGSDALTVGRVAERFGVTVRTLHHYDEIGLVAPGGRTPAGYRLYTEDDLTRLQHVVVYRRLGFALEEIADLLADPGGAESHLRRQRAAVMTRLEEMRGLVAAIDRALEQTMNGYQISKDEQRELFGDAFVDEDYQAEAERRWGDTPQWAQSQSRARSYDKAQWVRIKAEGDRVNADMAAAMQAGLPATSEPAMDAAEAARQQICRWFYDCSPQLHSDIAQLYVSDPRFTATYEDVAPGLATYTRDAIRANAARREV